MNIIIPMAGWGTRLRPHTLTVPKPLLKVAGKTVTQRLIDELIRSAGEKPAQIVFIIKPEFGPAIEKMLKDITAGYGIPARIVYQNEALGTAHAVYMAKDYLQGPVFIAYADTLFKGDIRLDPEADAVIFVKKVKNPEQFGVVQLDESDKKIVRFVEKPKEFVSDLAIIGIYYFKNGENLRDEIQYLIDNDIKKSGEYQLTDALIALLNKNHIFRPASIDRWMDFGNKNAVLQSLKEILDIEYREGSLPEPRPVRMENSILHPPVYIGEGVVLKNAEIGPYAAVENGTVIENSQIKNSLIGRETEIKNARLENSMLGNYVKIDMTGAHPSLDLGDYSKIGY